MRVTLVLLVFPCFIFFAEAILNEAVHTDNLWRFLMKRKNYNRLIRPVSNSSETLDVRLILVISQIIDINEKNQVMTTSVWLTLEWFDYKLAWDPAKFGGLSYFNMPAEDLWLPDIVLYNNADGNFSISKLIKARVDAGGRVQWIPPAIYKSSCPIDIQFFPFDLQICSMKFGPWSYDDGLVSLLHYKQPRSRNRTILIHEPNAIDFSLYTPSIEWDVVGAFAQRNLIAYPCCIERYCDITFFIELRRKSLYYTTNLIVPCLCISFISVFVFYLPSDSKQKVMLSISVWVSLTFFLVLISESIPSTSIAVPVIGKYLLFTLVLVTLSIAITVLVQNIRFKRPTANTVSPWTRRIFLVVWSCSSNYTVFGASHDRVFTYNIASATSLCSIAGQQVLPRLLWMERPEQKVIRFRPSCERDVTHDTLLLGGSYENIILENHVSSTTQCGNGGILERNLLLTPARLRRRATQPNGCAGMSQKTVTEDMLPCELRGCMDDIGYVVDHIQSEDKEKEVSEDYKYIAMVVDRLFLIGFLIACLVGAASILLHSPNLRDNRPSVSMEPVLLDTSQENYKESVIQQAMSPSIEY